MRLAPDTGSGRSRGRSGVVDAPGAGRTPVHRQARGEKRRRAILEATLRVIGREGISGVTHRSVAAEAGVPLASTTYYFASKADLLAEAFRYYAGRAGRHVEEVSQNAFGELGGMAPRLEDTVSAVVDFLLRELTGPRGDLVAEYELKLEANRQPQLRELSTAWHEQLVGRLSDVLEKLGSRSPRLDAFLLLMTTSGIEMHWLSRGDAAPPLDRVRESVARLLSALLGRPPAQRPG